MVQSGINMKFILHVVLESYIPTVPERIFQASTEGVTAATEQK
jgi:hypothetical protein